MFHVLVSSYWRTQHSFTYSYHPIDVHSIHSRTRIILLTYTAYIHLTNDTMLSNAWLPRQSNNSTHSWNAGDPVSPRNCLLVHDVSLFAGDRATRSRWHSGFKARHAIKRFRKQTRINPDLLQPQWMPTNVLCSWSWYSRERSFVGQNKAAKQNQTVVIPYHLPAVTMATRSKYVELAHPVLSEQFTSFDMMQS